MKKMKILVACEESQAVTIELRKLGHEAFSCDLLPCSGGYPEWHLQQDVFEVINQEWDMMIAFPPCTDLAVSGARHFERKRADGSQQRSIKFFMDLVNAPIEKIAIENPIGIMSSEYRKPNQIIQPWQFGDKAQKSTCLWLKNLPKLEHTNIVEKGEFFEFVSKKGEKKRMPMWYYKALQDAKTPEQRRTLRSKTFKGIAEAMANQWTNLEVIKNNKTSQTNIFDL
jgi:site-specific DNA-cytosine methylase